MVGDEQRGPLPLEDVRTLIRSGQATGDSFSWKEGQAEWLPLITTHPELFATSPAMPPPPLGNHYGQTSVIGPQMSTHRGDSSTKSEDRTLGVLVHIVGLFTSWVGPLIIYLIKKDDDMVTRDNAKEALNFQLTVMLMYVCCAVLSVLLIGFFLVGIVALIDLIFCIVAAVKTSGGTNYRYPMTIRLIK